MFSLLVLYQVMKEPRSLTPEMQQRCVEAAISGCSWAKDAGIRLKPKAHLLVHLCKQQVLAGNMSFFATFEDESFLKDVSRVIRRAHRARFAGRVLAKLALAEGV